MKYDEVRALEPGLYEITDTNGRTARAAVGALEGGGRWWADTTTLAFSSRCVSTPYWHSVASVRRLDGPQTATRGFARSAVQQALYSRLDDRLLDRLTSADYDAIVDAAWWSALPPLVAPSPSPAVATPASFTPDGSALFASGLTAQFEATKQFVPGSVRVTPVSAATKPAHVCESLWEFVQAASLIYVGKTPPLYMKALCDRADREARKEHRDEISRRKWREGDARRGAARPIDDSTRFDVTDLGPAGLADVVTGHRARTQPSSDSTEATARNACRAARWTAEAGRPNTPPMSRDLEACKPIDNPASEGYANTTAERALMQCARSPELLGLVHVGDPFEDEAGAHIADELEAHRRAWAGLRARALGYAASKLAEAGEAHTDAARLLLAQIAEDL